MHEINFLLPKFKNKNKMDEIIILHIFFAKIALN
jgi:hypothetical protein